MKSLNSEFLKVLGMMLIVGVVALSFAGCKDTNTEKNTKTIAELTSDNSNEVGSLENGNIEVTDDNVASNEPTVNDQEKALYDKDSENALKLVTGLLLGIAEGGITPTIETTIVDVKQGEKSFKIGSYDILKRVELAEVPKINLLDSNNAVWRISFTHHPKITVEVIDDVDNSQKVIKLYPQDNIE